MANLIPSIPSPTRFATKTLVLAHRAELLEQAKAQIERFNPTLRVAIEQGRRKVDVDNADVIVASVQSLGRLESPRLTKYNPDRFKAILIDEAHHAAAATYTRILDHFMLSSDIFIWGCSATVRRHDGLRLGNVFDDMSFHLDFLSMIEAGWLAPLKVTTIETRVDLSSVSIQNHDFHPGQLSLAVNTTERNSIILNSWTKFAQAADTKRQSTLVFAVDIAHTKELCEQFRQRGIHAEYITSETNARTRQDLLRQFRDRQFPVMVNCGILTEGTDIPAIDCLLMARPTRSSILFQQMMGRGMRLFPGKNDCLVIDFVDNFKRSGLITIPTLMGLDPDTIAQGENILDLEKKAKEAETVLDPLVPIHNEAVKLKITEYDDLQEFMTLCSGMAARLQNISRHPWVAIGDDKFCLSIVGYGRLLLTWDAAKSEWAGQYQKKRGVAYQRGQALPLDATDIETALRAADTWVQQTLHPANYHRWARFRKDPMTDKQRAALARYKVMPLESEGASLTKGQAMDLLTRLSLGQSKLWRQQCKRILQQKQLAHLQR
ncbi:P-loop containing nucleoside triphosphate hydrolase protein [Hesseltinella vesiculosa]|uniref:P-loop containing nucleoside triphosphate hydrolase protein n=1 Tax=Hesseltinella vesiculosa TaxID=101127 RepID=A0A1X2GCF9_9FUNG|nr:P-loop containing nucleoside triphosphate hydrolase protein [Hesseltinella vesiculosa]